MTLPPLQFAQSQTSSAYADAMEDYSDHVFSGGSINKTISSLSTTQMVIICGTILIGLKIAR